MAQCYLNFDCVETKLFKDVIINLFLVIECRCIKQLDKKVQRPAIGGAGHHVTVAALHGIGGLIVT